MQKKVLYLKYLILGFNIIVVMGISAFIHVTTERICDAYVGRGFLGSIKAFPSDPPLLFVEVTLLVLILITSFLYREKVLTEYSALYYILLGIDYLVCLLIIGLLDFNYNGILLWVFANITSLLKRLAGKYLLIVIAFLSYIGTDYGVASLNFQLFSIKDYIGFYGSRMQHVMLWCYNVMLSLNIILFLIFCVYIIVEQNDTIIEVRGLYQKLYTANSELQKANTRLQEYAVIKEKMGETKERNRLAREIHDTLGHTLTGISAGIDACIAMIDLSPETTKNQLEIISRVTRDGIKDIRRSVSELRPDALERLSLEHAIKKMVAETNSMTSTKIHFQCDVELLKFDEDEENAIYRVVQESITNAIRHGHARNVYIHISRDYSDIHIIIKDDGIGCSNMKQGFGTRHIIERVGLLNGTVEFNGEHGFKTEVIIPIRWGEEYD